MMLVCICNGVSDSQIKQTLQNGASSFEEVHARLGVGGCCGECECYARSLVEESLNEFAQANMLARNAA